MSKAILGLIAATLLLANATADTIVVIDDNLDSLPASYTFVEFATTNSTADIQIGDIGGSNGLIFDGSWDVPANGEETAIGALSPVIPTAADFQLYPADIEGIANIRWMLDLEVISSTMTPPDQGIFAQLVVFQEQSDGSVAGFPDGGNFIEAGQATTLDVVVIESDFGQPGAHPDFSATGLPMSFGLQLGATYPRTTSSDAFFVDGRMTADNWKVEVTRAGIFRDRFESNMVITQPAGLTTRHKDNCKCPMPPVTHTGPRLPHLQQN